MLLADDEVHIWRIATDRPRDLAALRRLLSDDEQAKADRYRFEKDRRRAVVRRAALRKILARYTGASPAELKFTYGPHGKPRLDESSASGYHFNLSFSGELALCAVARSPLGIDVERERTVENAGLVAKHFFTAAEIALQNAAADANGVFLRHWTRKEALIKATGTGLSVPLNSFDVGGFRAQGDEGVSAQASGTQRVSSNAQAETSSKDDSSMRQITLLDASGAPTTWWLNDLMPPPGWYAALATARLMERLEWRDADLEA
jgi:4'-phosphopantetheinyl transferase